jgi:hypothetical protein
MKRIIGPKSHAPQSEEAIQTLKDLERMRSEAERVKALYYWRHFINRTS